MNEQDQELRRRLQAALGEGYTLEQELMGGGMSRVFVAFDAALNRKVVVKVLAPELAQELSAERFEREVKLTASLQHPNVVPVLHAGNAGGLPYYIMPYVRGDSLRTWCERVRATGERVPLEEAITALRDVARALAHAHGDGVVHRDVKPDNVLLSSGAAAVTDFGIAKAITASRTVDQQPSGTIDRLTGEARAIGTPGYMAPEQAAGERVDHRTDIYAWGVMAWELLAGEHPFAGYDAERRLAAQMAEEPPQLSEHRADVPGVLSALVMRCMERDPARRPQSASELLRVLEQTRSAPSDFGWTRSRVLTAAAALTALLVLIGGVYLWRAGERAGDLDPRLVVVLPFRVAAADPSFAYLREGMLDLLAAKLTGEPRTVDQRAVLAEWRRAGGDRAELEPRRAAEVGRALGAGRVMLGDIVGTPDRVTFTASLLDAATDRERARASAVGSASALALLVDSLVNRLLVLDAGEGMERSHQLARIPVEALQHFLAGQAHYRLGRYQLAGDAYIRALQVDSTFALAGVMMARTADWTFDTREAFALRVARRHIASLGARDRLLIRTPDPDHIYITCADRIADLEARVAQAPDLPELWYDLADRWVHCGSGLVGLREASRRALRGFERALALDSMFSPAQEHLTELYTILGDTAALAVARQRAVRDTNVHFIGLRRLFVAQGNDERDVAVRAITERRGTSLAYALYLIQLLGEQTEALDPLLDGWRAVAATAAEQEQVRRYEIITSMNRGQMARASRVSGDPESIFGSPILKALFWDGDSTAAARSVLALEPVALADPPRDAAAFARWLAVSFDLAQWRLAHGDTAGARQKIARIRDSAAAGTPAHVATAQGLSLLLEAQLAEAQRRPDAPRLLASLDSLLSLGPTAHRTRLVGNIVAARLWEKAGDLERANTAAQRYGPGPGVAELTFFSTYLREQGRLAAQLGHRDEALRAYRHYLTIRADAEPALQPHLEAIRAEVRRLEDERRP